MNATQTISEPIPLEVALIFVAFGGCAGFYALATGFLPKHRKTLRWGRGPKLQPVGPVLSRWSHAAVGALGIMGPVALVGESFGIQGAAAYILSLMAGIVSAATIGGVLYDSACYLRGRSG